MKVSCYQVKIDSYNYMKFYLTFVITVKKVSLEHIQNNKNNNQYIITQNQKIIKETARKEKRDK